MLCVVLKFYKPGCRGILKTKFFFNSTFGSFLKSGNGVKEVLRLLAQQHYEKHADEHKQGAKSTVFKICFFEKKPA